ncbi:hypothetical protein NYE33_14835 [Paenibacillus sp. FSL R10-2199]|uniref:RCC1 domain-containing protein n=1 Tax=Paenibacillus sp. FSL R10-2199 TaxID=2975348 RepID=UPI0030F801B9
MIQASGSQSFLLKSEQNGTLSAWGSNVYGQLGDGTKYTKTTAIDVPLINGIASISSGEEHTIAVKSDGSVVAWGNNNNGQLGDGTIIQHSVPVAVSILNGIIEVTAGSTQSFALKGDGTVWGWGQGYGTTPVAISGLSGIAAIAAGGTKSMALKSDGTVWTWSNGVTPSQVAGVSGIIAIAMGAGQYLTLKGNGTVWSWGSNSYGEVGDGTTVQRTTPAAINGLSGITAIAAGNMHSLALKNDGSVWTWGYNGYGQLGDGSTSTKSTPVQVSGLSGVKDIAGGYSHSVAMKSDGSVWAWGNNASGQLGDGSIVQRLTPVEVVGNTAPQVTVTTPSGTQSSPTAMTITKPTIGWTQTDAAVTTFTGYQVQVLDESGAVVLDSGVQATSTLLTSNTWTATTALPAGQKLQVRVKVTDGAAWSEWSAMKWMTISTVLPNKLVAAGSGHSTSIDSAGLIRIWGNNGNGQLGDGSAVTVTRTTSVNVPGVSGAVSVVNSDSHTVVLKSDGSVAAWGYNYYGQLGDGTNVQRATPVAVSGLTSGIIAVAAGSNQSLALKSDGTVWGWGQIYGTTPVSISGLSGIVAIASSNMRGMALKSDGTVWTWSNGVTPSQVAGVSGITAIAMGNGQYLTLKGDGTVWSWGSNSYGEVGDGTTVQRTIPAAISGLNGITAIAAGNTHSLAVKSDGSVWTWGYNGYGQLGDGSTTTRVTPVQVSGLSGVKTVAGGYSHSLTQKTDGSVWAWGNNSSGQLGDGSTVQRLTPVAVVRNTAPQVTVTTPSGTQASPSVFNITKPTIGWTQADAAVTTFTGYQVQVLDESGVVVLDSGVQTSSTLLDNNTWAVTTALPVGQKLQVRVKVTDGAAWSEWSAMKWMTISTVLPNKLVAAGGSHSTSIDSAGLIRIWGTNGNGQLGDGSAVTVTRTTSVNVPGVSGAVSVVNGDSHTVVLKSDGSVAAWGYNYYGQLGDGTNVQRATPVAVSGLTSGIIAVAAGSNQSLALKSDGTVWGWGQIYGTTPVSINGLSGIVAIASSNMRGMALKSDGTVWTWSNGVTPSQVAGVSGITAIAMGNGQYLTLKGDGTVWSWGSNSYGEVGDGTTVQRTIPAAISGLNGITAIAAGNTHSLAVKSDGSVWTWGYNYTGQLGDGSTTTRVTPVQVSGLSGVKTVAGGYSHSLAQKTDGSVWAWGNNSSGQLGDGSIVQRLTPVAVVGNTAPQVTVTTPSGTQASPSVFNITKPMIGWTQADAAVTTFTGYQVQVLDESGVVVLDSGVQTSSTLLDNNTWAVTTALPVGQKLQLRVKVTDGAAWSEWSAMKWMTISTVLPNKVVAAGSGHSTAIDSAGLIRIWGTNGNGQLGDGSAVTVTRTTSVNVPGVSGAVSVANGSSHTLVLKSDGSVMAWGFNSSGQLGDGTNVQRATPVTVSGLTSGVNAVAAGANQSFALKSDGTVWGWGQGYGTSPVAISSLSGIVAIASCDTRVMALKSDGTVWTWSNGVTPSQVAGVSGITAIAMGNGQYLALKGDGTVWSWGSNSYGEVGDGTTVQRTIPAAISGLNGITAIAAGNTHSLAVKSDGSVWTWGYNYTGQLGDGSTTTRVTPVQVSGLSGVKTVAGGYSHSLAQKTDGSVWAWGNNSSGQLGDGSTVQRLTPVAVVGNTAPQVTVTTPSGTQTSPTAMTITKPTIGWTQADAAVTTFTGYQVQVLDESGAVVLDSEVQVSSTLLDNNTWAVSTALPAGKKLQVRVKVTDGAAWSEWSSVKWMMINTVQTKNLIAAGSGHSTAIDSAGLIRIWGNNGNGQLGDGSAVTVTRTTSVNVPGVNGAVSVANGSSHTLVLKSDGSVMAWGYNYNGQLGDGTSVQRTTPVAVSTLTSGIIAVAAGSSQSFALKSDGTVWGWGQGYGTSPVAISSLSGIVAIAAGGTNGMALKSDGTVWIWTTGGTPIQMTGVSGVTAIAVGAGQYLTLKGDGTVWSWGSNSYGEVGDGTTVQRTIPAAISGLNGITAIAAGNTHSLAVKSDGSVWTWGYNGYGQLGDGSTTTRVTPVQVSGLSGVKTVAGGYSHSLAQKTDGSVWAWGNNSSGQLGDGSIVQRLTPVAVVGNTAPQVTVTTPSGTQASPSVFNITKPTIGWTQADAAVTTFTEYQVQVLDESGAVVLDSGVLATNTSLTSNTWTVTTAIPTFKKLQVRVKVTDGAIWSEWSVIKWMISQ